MRRSSILANVCSLKNSSGCFIGEVKKEILFSLQVERIRTSHGCLSGDSKLGAINLTQNHTFVEFLFLTLISGTLLYAINSEQYCFEN